jgi:hypothetical protein
MATTYAVPAPKASAPKGFAHHLSKDNQYDSVCPICFRTIAIASRERDLGRLERKHVCSPDDLAFQPKFGLH